MASGSSGREAATGQADVLGLAASAAALSDGTVRSVDLVSACLDRIAEAQPVLNAFRSARAEAALSEAESADRRIEHGERLPLLGVPVAIKDDMVLAGDPTRRGCAGSSPVERHDGEVARRLRKAGAIIVGKTNLPEFGQWPFTEGTFGRTRNPWNLDRTPGGSSGGSAGAVAAGAVPATLGRWCGVGAQPPHLYPSRRHQSPAGPGLDVARRRRVQRPHSFGPLARTVEDAALLLDAAQSNHSSSRDQPALPLESFAELARRSDPGRLRIGLPSRHRLRATHDLTGRRTSPLWRDATELLHRRSAARVVPSSGGRIGTSGWARVKADTASSSRSDSDNASGSSARRCSSRAAVTQFDNVESLTPSDRAIFTRDRCELNTNSTALGRNFSGFDGRPTEGSFLWPRRGETLALARPSLRGLTAQSVHEIRRPVRSERRSDPPAAQPMFRVGRPRVRLPPRGIAGGSSSPSGFACSADGPVAGRRSPLGIRRYLAALCQPVGSAPSAPIGASSTRTPLARPGRCRCAVHAPVGRVTDPMGSSGAPRWDLHHLAMRHHAGARSPLLLPGSSRRHP